MMNGYLPHACRSALVLPRYEVIARNGGWSVSLNGACTRPFADRGAAERVAAQLQKQANGLHHAVRRNPRYGRPSNLENE